MQISHAFSIRELPRPHFGASTRCELLRLEQPTGKIFDGSNLAAALDWEECHLIMLCDSTTFDAWLSIHLLSHDLSEIDRAEIHYENTIGWLLDLKTTDPNEVEFKFPTEALRWRMCMWSKPKLKARSLAKAILVTRKYWFRQYFSLDSSPAEVNDLLQIDQ